MAEKRRLLAEVEKCFKKIDEGLDLFEDIMNKLQEANSDNQREKYQDELKKEIKKLQRLRDQVKGWQSSSDIKDKQRLNEYRRVIENKMEQFKDIERENKTKPHSKVGLCAEEKVDPKEKEKSETIEWLQLQLRTLNDESDRTETQIESLSSQEGGKRRGKKDDAKKGEKEKKMKALNGRLERLKFHIGKLEVIMRLVNNESLQASRIMDVLKDSMEMFTDAMSPDYEGGEDDFLTMDPEECYDELNLGHLCALLGTVSLASLDDERDSSHDSGAAHEEAKGSRHGSTDVEAFPSLKKAASSVIVATVVPSAKLIMSSATESPALASSSVATPPSSVTYTRVASARAVSTATPPPSAAKANTSGKATFPIPSVVRQPSSQTASPVVSTISIEEPPKSQPSTSAISEPPIAKPMPVVVTGRPADVLPEMAALLDQEGSTSTSSPSKTTLEQLGQQVMRERVLERQITSNEPQRAKIPPSLGVSPLGPIPETPDMEKYLVGTETAFEKNVLPFECQMPRTYLPSLKHETPGYYAQKMPQNSDTLAFYVRMSPETLFFVFYYMEGTKAQLLAAQALKKLSWRFHLKYLMWFQRLEEPILITDDYEKGTYNYFDYQKWGQQKKEGFAFEYEFLEDYDLNKYCPHLNISTQPL